MLFMEASPSLPEDRFAYPLPILPDRNPLINQKFGGTGLYEQQEDVEQHAGTYPIPPHFVKNILPLELFSQMKGLLTTTEQRPTSSPDHPQSPLNPRRQRPLYNAIIDEVIHFRLLRDSFMCLDLNSDEERQKIAELNLPNTLESALKHPIPQDLIDYFFRERKPLTPIPYNPEEEDCLHFGTFDPSQDLPIADFLLNSVAPKLILTETKPVDLKRGEMLYQKYCTQCHSQQSHIGIILPLPQDEGASWHVKMREYKRSPDDDLPLAAKRIILGEMPMGQEIPEADRLDMINFLLSAPY